MRVYNVKIVVKRRWLREQKVNVLKVYLYKRQYCSIPSTAQIPPIAKKKIVKSFNFQSVLFLLIFYLNKGFLLICRVSKSQRKILI